MIECGIASQSSAFGPPARAIDGNTNGNYFGGSCSHTAAGGTYHIDLAIKSTTTLLVNICRSDNYKCTFCSEVEESIVHLFWDCKFTFKYWKDFQNWINSNLNASVSLTQNTVLFGNYIFKDYVFNNILLVLKFNIYKSRVKKTKTLLFMERRI